MSLFNLGKTHVPHRKNTASMAAVRMAPPAEVEILMSQHIGAPSVPTVSVGDKVEVGQLIADAAQGLSVPQYASISGKIVSVDPSKIVIEA